MSPLERLTAALVGRYRIERELGQGGMTRDASFTHDPVYVRSAKMVR